MTIAIGNAPCSWGVEFPDDPRNPEWARVLEECREAGYRGIELGPIGFMPEDPAILGEALATRGLTLIGGVVFRPFHDAAKWERGERCSGSYLQGAGRAWRAPSRAYRLDLAAARRQLPGVPARPNR